MSIDVKSLREWLASWGEGPNYADPKGMTVPIAKRTLLELLDAVDGGQIALRGLRARLLDAPNTTSMPLLRANLLTMAEDALHPEPAGKGRP